MDTEKYPESQSLEEWVFDVILNDKSASQVVKDSDFVGVAQDRNSSNKIAEMIVVGVDY